MSKPRIKSQYKGLSRQKLLDKAYELGAGFEMYSLGCSQCTVATIHELVEMDDIVVKVSNSLSGGSGLQVLGTCGALSGGIIALDYFFGRPVERMSYKKVIKANTDKFFAATEASGLIADKFIGEYGTFICAGLQRKLYGRFFWVRDPEEMIKINEAGAHSDPTKCPHIVGNAARWVMEILLDKKAIQL